MPDDEARRLLAVATALPLAELERLERLDRIDQLRRAMGITVSELVELAREVKKRAR